MTNEQAAIKLQNILNDDHYAWTPAHAEALRMAIDALKCSEIPNSSNDCISRKMAIDALGERPRLWTGCDYELGCANQYDLDRLAIETVPSAQPEQRYTEEELRVFAHGISLSLLSKRSAQHWQYDEDTATEIEFLERLYDKVSAGRK